MRRQAAIPAVFMRGGTSKGLFFHERDLPARRADRDAIFLSALGSPDPYGRQLDGMGGGLSSLSKAVVIAPPTRADADLDYWFAQVSVDAPVVDYGGTCGNLVAAVAHFAVEEGLVPTATENALVRIHTANTGKMIHAHLPLFGGQPRYDGDLVIPGVAGSGAPVQVEFLDPDGSRTGLLLPTRNAADMLDVPVGGAVRASLVDSSSPCVFVAAEALGLSGTELPADLDADRELCARLEAIRTAAGVAMGFGTDAAVVSAVSPASPKVAIVSPVGAAMTLDGKTLEPTTYDLSVRMISMGKAHRVIPLTGALCVAVAAGIPGTVVHEMLAERRHDSDLRIGTASGVVPVNASFVRDAEGFRTERAVVYRTARRLMEGRVLVPTMIAGEQN